MLRDGFRTSAHDTHQLVATGCACCISRFPQQHATPNPTAIKLRTKLRYT